MSTAASVQVGSLVHHIKDDSLRGVVVEVDDNLIDVTTCRVVWDVETLDAALATPRQDQDIQWTNKLVLLPR